MSFLDIDERLIELTRKVDFVFSPLIDAKQFPSMVDITLIEGAVGTTDDLAKIRRIRSATRTLVAFGDCAITANVPSMRNPYPVQDVLEEVYLRADLVNDGIATQMLPPLIERCLPLHHLVQVDLFIPGCPPSADAIYYAVTELIEGRSPDLSARTRFGA